MLRTPKAGEACLGSDRTLLPAEDPPQADAKHGTTIARNRFFLRTRPPVGQQLQEVVDADTAAVEVAIAGGPPVGEQL